MGVWIINATYLSSLFARFSGRLQPFHYNFTMEGTLEDLNVVDTCSEDASAPSSTPTPPSETGSGSIPIIIGVVVGCAVLFAIGMRLGSLSISGVTKEQERRGQNSK